jgi:hypothetical protein
VYTQRGAKMSFFKLFILDAPEELSFQRGDVTTGQTERL